MAENADVIRGGYEAFGRGDLEAALEPFADDIEWEGPNYESLPGGGTHRGRDAVAGVLEEITKQWETFQVSPDEFIEGGETVVVLGHLEGRARSTGNEVKAPFVHVWRLSGGRARRIQVLTDTAVVADALGV